VLLELLEYRRTLEAEILSYSEKNAADKDESMANTGKGTAKHP
jgi:hypothetical protein